MEKTDVITGLRAELVAAEGQQPQQAAEWQPDEKLQQALAQAAVEIGQQHDVKKRIVVIAKVLKENARLTAQCNALLGQLGYQQQPTYNPKGFK